MNNNHQLAGILITNTGSGDRGVALTLGNLVDQLHQVGQDLPANHRLEVRISFQPEKTA